MKLISKAALIAVVAGSSMISSAVNADPAEMFYSSKDLRAVEVLIPEYPRRAELSGVEGYTIVEFTVMPDGSVVEPAVKISNSRLFSRAALAAIEEWKFEPVVADAGEAIPVRSSLKFNFVGRD
jgi:periplasmic protein TonB